METLHKRRSPKIPAEGTSDAVPAKDASPAKEPSTSEPHDEFAVLPVIAGLIVAVSCVVCAIVALWAPLYVTALLACMLGVCLLSVLSCTLAVCEGSRCCAGAAMFEGSKAKKRSDDSPSCDGNMVLLHVYDLGQNFQIQLLNSALLKMGNVIGAFHTGVEVYGNEWGYGYIEGDGSAVYSIPPKSNTDHNYRFTLELGVTPVSEEELDSIVERLSGEWISDDFHSFHHNCIDFCDVLCRELQVGGAPSWVLRGHRWAATFFGNTEPDEPVAEMAADGERNMAQEAGSSAW